MREVWGVGTGEDRLGERKGMMSYSVYSGASK